MTQEATQPSKKEAAAISEASLSALGRELPAYSGIKLCMYLNVPTVTLVKLRESARQSKADDFRASVDGLLYWKHMRATAREKEKVTQLEKALREVDKADIAEVLMEKHRENVELTADSFTR